MTRAPHLALFGGSFDPVHRGHLEIARRAVDALELDEVRFLPCRLSPHKLDHPPSPGDHRLAMLRLATAGLPWAVVDDFELRAPPPSYSSRTVREMRRRHPGTRLFWIVGADQWRSLPTWREPETLAAELEFIVFARDGRPEPREGWRMHHIAGDHPASSSAIREAVRAGRDVSAWLPEGVGDYIRAHRLYLD